MKPKNIHAVALGSIKSKKKTIAARLNSIKGGLANKARLERLKEERKLST